MQTKVYISLLATFLCAVGTAPGVTLLTGPTFTQATNAPLAGVLRLATDVDSRVSISVSDGMGSWTRNFHEYGNLHSVNLAGFKPGRTNQVLVTVLDRAQNVFTAEPMVFVTPALPADFPHSVVLHSEPDKMEPGYTLFIVQNRTAKTAYVTIMDSGGEVVWYTRAASAGVFDVRQMPNGNFFIEEQPPLNRFVEINLLGETVNTWFPPAQYPINDHDGVVTDHGTILYLSDVSQLVSNFPSSTTNAQPALVTATIDDNPVVEISITNGALLNAWAPINLLDPTRVTYLTYQFASTFGVDNEHANAVIEDKTDNSIIASLRNQNAVFKFLRSNGALKWILGPHANWAPQFQPYLLTPTGTPFEWNYGQHAPKLTPQHTLLLYDDGNNRAEPFAPPIPDQNNYSRAVEYSINETTLEVTQIWDSIQAPGDRLFTPAVGDADWLPQSGNILVTYGLVTYVNGIHPSATATNASMARIRELTHEAVPKVVFELAFFDSNNTQPGYAGYLCYRSDRIGDFYAHPAMPVQDLTVTLAAGAPVLLFSADGTRSYVIEASTDALHWQAIGKAAPGPQPDTFTFQDAGAGDAAVRFYRVVTN